jgi:branched-chain amino acid transport system substrate-binding protein
MSKTAKYIIAIVVIILVVAGVWYFGSKSTPISTETGPIKIGAILSLTGDASVDAKNIQKGIDLAKEDLAQRGVSVEINYQDDKTNPKETVSGLEFLLSNKLDAIIGPTWSFLEDAGAPIIDKAKIVAYAPADTSEVINEKSDYVFHGTIKNSEKAEPVANWLTANKKKNVAIIVSQDAWGKSHELAYTKAIELSGGKVTMIERLPFGLEDAGLATVLTKVKSTKSEALLWTGYNDGALAIIRKSQELNLDIPIIGTEGFSWVVNNGTIKLGPKQEIYSLKSKVSSEFISKFEAKFGEKPGTYADTAYDGLMILVQAIQNARNNNTDTLSSMKSLSYNGYAGRYQFDENNDRIKGGEWVLEKLK